MATREGRIIMPLFNTTTTTWDVVQSLTVNVTGSLFLTLFMILILVMLIAMVLRIPVEFTMILVLPFLLTVWAYSGDFLAFAGTVLIYLGILLGKNFFFR